MLVLLAGRDEQAFADRGGDRARPAGSFGDRRGLGRQLLVGELVEVLADGRHPVLVERDGFVEGRADGTVARYAGGVGHLVPREIEWVPGGGVAEDRPADPG